VVEDNPGGICMNNGVFVPTRMDVLARSEILDRGYTRRRLNIDEDVARALAELANAAWSMPRDQYYDAGTRYRTLNRFSARIVEDGVIVAIADGNKPYVQLDKYNTTIGSQPRQYAPLPVAIADSAGVRKLMARHLRYLPWSEVGKTYAVNMHVMRFAATPSQPCDTSPPGLHKDGEKYLAVNLLARCGAGGGEVIITDNDNREMDRITMSEPGECYAFDDDRIWHMLTPLTTLDGNEFAYRDTLAFDMLPDDWSPAA
jgi:hypothetical protein